MTMPYVPLSAFREAVTNLTNRLRQVETRERAEQAGAVQAVLFAALPAAGQPGRLRFVLDGRKVGEFAGSGTGVLCYDDGTNWVRSSDDTAVAV